jgi:RNA polymerase sigma-70 factor (ECF subfamily)
MNPNESFTELMQRLRHRDQDAAARVFHQFCHRLKALARSRLGERVLRREECDDVLQSMWKSFFNRQAAGQFADVTDWESLWTLLACLTVRKCINRVAYFSALCRREPESSADRPAGERAGDEPTPEEEAVYRDLLERFLRGMSPRDRDIVTLELQGYDDAEISRQVGTSERTVSRVRRRVRNLLEEQLAAEPPP